MSAPVASSIREAMAGRPHHGNASIGGELFLIVSEPARFAEEVLGTMTAGFAIDDGVVAELAELAHVDVNLVAGDRLAASSLRGEPRAALAALLAAPKPSGSGSAPRLSDLQGPASELEPLAGRRYVAGAFPLATGRGSAQVGRLLQIGRAHV